MRFVLHYRGPLKANAGPAHKHEIRRLFRAQLKTLWSHKPLVEHEDLLRPPSRTGSYSLVRETAPFTFIPLVSAQMDIVAELSVTILRPEPPGSLITQGATSTTA